MSYTGILVDTNYCTGCLSCVLACQQEHEYSENEFGVQVTKVGPFKIGEFDYQYDFVPQFTDWCDLCEQRIDRGKNPSCVDHCQSRCLQWGKVDDLAAKMFGTKQLIFSIREE